MANPLSSCDSLKNLELLLDGVKPQIGKHGGRKFVLPVNSNPGKAYSFNQLIQRYQQLLNKTEIRDLKAFQSGARIATLLSVLNRDNQYKVGLTTGQQIKLKVRQAIGNLMFATLHAKTFSRDAIQKNFLSFYTGQYHKLIHKTPSTTQKATLQAEYNNRVPGLRHILRMKPEPISKRPKTIKASILSPSQSAPPPINRVSDHTKRSVPAGMEIRVLQKPIRKKRIGTPIKGPIPHS